MILFKDNVGARLALVILLLRLYRAQPLAPSRPSWTRPDITSSDQVAGSPRRQLLQAIPGLLPSLLGLPRASYAAAPVSQQETEGARARFLRAVRPKPMRLLRNKLNQEFAVLLMRSSYNALDELDCVPMDQFQRDFFLVRQAEYEPYIQALGQGVVQQGDLTDPYYFDFISFAQYQTIQREISNDPPSVFIEKQPVEDSNGIQQFSDIVVKRDPSIRNDMLPAEHARRVGASIIDRFDTIYQDTPLALPNQMRKEGEFDAGQVQRLLSQLVYLFVFNGFAWDGSASLSKEQDGTIADYILTLQAPANLWSGQGLQLERSSLKNDFLLKAAQEMLRQRGFEVLTSSVDYKGTAEVTRIRVTTG